MISKVFFLVASSCLLGSAFSTHIVASIIPAAVPEPATITSYHSQNEAGEYSYGYSGGPSAKHETKTADGITQGGYSYIDAHGLTQHVNYISDPHNGFRAAGTNFPLPVPAYAPHPLAPEVVVPIAEAVAPADTVEVAHAKLNHFAEKHAATVAALHSRKRRSAIFPYAFPVAQTYAAPLAVPYVAPLAVQHAAPYYAAPLAIQHATPYYAAPAPAVVPVAGPTASQYQSQNEAGEYSYGYANQDSAKEEVKTADGITRGSYSYRDAHGFPQHVSYVSDPHNGFRAAGTNFPVAA